jgi:hypothetical protein
MSVFVKFEEEVIDILVVGTLTRKLITSLKRDGLLVSYEYTGYGYFLKVAHPLLPKTRIVCSQPMVTGTSGDIHASFVIFIENHQVTLEGFPDDGNALPPNFRELDVLISQPNN